MSILVAKVERQRVEYTSLSSHYRSIGPAAIQAAILCVPRKRVTSFTVRQPTKKTS